MIHGKLKINLGIGLFLFAFAILSSCGPSRKAGIDISKYKSVYPTELTTEVNSGHASLRWRTNRGDAPIQGYNIYISKKKVVIADDTRIADGIKPFNIGAYPGDTDPATDYETFQAKDLKDGVVYYAAVTIVYSGKQQSRPSNMIEFVCHPHGQFTLRQSFSGEHDGYSFSKADYVPTDDLENHIYYTQIKGEDYLLSPSRLDDVLKSVRFFPLKIKSIDDRFNPPTGGGSDKIRIKKGDGCLLKTDTGQFAKIIVKGFSQSGKEREVALEYSFMPIAGRTDF